MHYLILTITFLGGIVTSSLVTTYHSPCARLVAIEEARDAKVEEREAQQRAFFAPSTQPRPQIENPGIYEPRTAEKSLVHPGYKERGL